LDAGQLEAGHIPLRRTLCSVNALVEQTVQGVRMMAEQKNVQLVLSRSSPALWLEVDIHRMAQALTNLLENAIRYAPAGSPVEISARPVESGCELAVKDLGPGIDLRSRVDIFQRYSRAGPHPADGAGLGLFIANVAVRAHGGNMWVKSEPGAGATFGVVLPLSSQPNANQ
jgi:signal transduction histidine kinase